MRPFLVVVFFLLALSAQGCDRSDVAALFLGSPDDAAEIEARLATQMPDLLKALARVRSGSTPRGTASGETRGRGLALNRLKRAVAGAQRHMDAVSGDLNDLLRAQDAEIAELYALRQENRIDKALFDDRIRSMRNQRDLLAQALAVAAGHAEAAQRQMRLHGNDDSRREQRILDRIVALEEEAEAARLRLSLL